MIIEGKYYLVTALDWFYSPINGEPCKAAWGKAQIITMEETFKFKPLRPSTNWFLKLGMGEGSIMIGGCQIYYAIECAKRPFETKETYLEKGVPRTFNHIYFTEE